MPVITVSIAELSELSGVSVDLLLESLPELAVEVDKVEKDELTLEVNPDRCDLLSVEGMARALRGFHGFETGMPHYDIIRSEVTTEVELSVQEVRPYIVTAVLEKVDMTDNFLKSLMNVQEKLHLTLGRGREKVAIGVHDLSKVVPPFVYKGVNPATTSFVPLNRDRDMTMEDILSKHEKGKEYAHLLEGSDRYPLLLDSKGNVLSFPPVINSRLTEVTQESTRLFIDVTGNDLKAIEQSLNILCSIFHDRGAEIYSTKVVYGNKEHHYPDLSYKSMDLSIPEVRDMLGVPLDTKNIKEILYRMGYEPGESDGDNLKVEYPAYRHDIIHPWDILEDIAIGYGYHRFHGDLPRSFTVGRTLRSKKIENTVTELMIGYGFNEVMNFTLSSFDREFTQMELPPHDEYVEIQNPVSEDSSCLRVWILPSLLTNLRNNRKNPLPQRIFEVGDVLEGYHQMTHVGGVILDSESGFSMMKSLMDGLVRSLGIDFITEKRNHPSFIDGRCASLTKDGVEIGLFGEIHPKVLNNFRLEYPAVSFELDISKLYEPTGE